MYSDRLIINAAITGCVHRKSSTPYLPVSVAEIVECAYQVREAGASIVHLHAREADESPSCDAEIYCELVDKIRHTCGDIIVCVTLSGRCHPSLSDRAASLASKPDLASLTLGSMNFAKEPNVNSPEIIQALAKLAYSAGVVPELEIFDTGFIGYAKYLSGKGILKPPYYFNFILGSLGTAPLDLIGLGHMISMLPEKSTWSVGGVGRYQLDANVISIASGGHVRVGIEDCIHFDKERTTLADNAQLVDRVVRIARELGREPATPSEARAIIGLKSESPVEALEGSL
jgi:3-keto-5-aminohexanoate cleavage enzyme